MRAVLDTSIFIAGFVSDRSYPYQALALWTAKRYQLVTSTWQIEEIRRVSRRDYIKKVITAHQIGRVINGLRERAIVIDTLPEVDLSPDPDDNPIIATALAGDAQYLVSGDKRDLLALGRVEGVSIVTAREFVGQLLS